MKTVYNLSSLPISKGSESYGYVGYYADRVYPSTCGDGVFWDLDDDVLYVSGNGVMSDYRRGEAPWYPYASSITSLVVDEGMTYIGMYAMYRCTALSSVSFPDSLVSIGDDAFTGCRSLASLTTPINVTVLGGGSFRNCTSLADVVLFEGLVSIGDDTFDGCYSIGHIVIPSTVTEIGYNAFGDTIFKGYRGEGVLEHTPEQLSGNVFSGTDGVLVLQLPDVTVTYVVDGETFCTQVYENRDPIEVPGDPGLGIPFGYTKYDFLGWEGYTEGMLATEDVTFVAIFDKTTIPFDITFVYPDFSVTFSEDYGTPVRFPGAIPYKASSDGTTYTFVGWEGYTEGMTVDGERTFTAMFKADHTCTVTIVYNDGTSESVEVPKNGTLTEPRQAWKYYRDEAMTKEWSSLTRIRADITIYALVTASGSAGGDTLWDLDLSTGTLTISGTGATSDWSPKTTPWYGYRDSITNLVVEEGITHLGSCALYKYPYLNDVVLPDSLVGVGRYSIAAYSLEHMKVGYGLKEMGVRGFHGMTFMEGSDVLPIRPYALAGKDFLGTDGVLQLVSIDGVADEVLWTIEYATQTLTIYGNGSAGDWTATTAPWYSFRGYFENVVVEDGVTEIGDYSFYAYSGIKSIVLGDDVERIGVNSLRKCSSLTEIVFGEGLTSIGSNALTGYTFTVDGKNVKTTVTNLAGHTFIGARDMVFERST